MPKHLAICRVATELADAFRESIPSDTRIIAESILERVGETWFRIESQSFPETPSDEKLPFVKALFLRSDDGVITFAKWETYA